MSAQDKIQNEVEDAWRLNNFRGTGLLATGSGKSKIFINILCKDKKKWLLVVPTQKLRDKNWKEEFKKWKKTRFYNKYLTTCCYASLSKVDLSEYDGVCLDEAHNITEKNSVQLRVNKTIKILALTATLPRDLNKTHLLFNVLNCNVIYKLSLKNAIDLKIVAPLKIFVHQLTLSTEKNIKVEYKCKKTRKLKSFYQSEQDQYDYICKRIAKKHTPTQMDYLFRTRFIYNSKVKTDYAIKLVKIFKDVKTLIFSQSIKQIDTILDETFHSKTTDHYYNLFCKDKIKVLGVVESINEGENISNLDVGLIVQFNSNPLNLFQRIGRIIRKRPNHTAKIHILVLKNTVDEKWLSTILEDYEELITYVDGNK